MAWPRIPGAGSIKETMPIPKKVEAETSLEYGSYLVNNVANCAGCHTTFNINKMEYDGVRLAGGGEFGEKEHIFKAPNLTPDPKTGHIFHWTEEQFIARFRAGRVYNDTPMPWTEFKRFSENDLKAIYRYLKSIEPSENDTSPVVRAQEKG